MFPLIFCLVSRFLRLIVFSVEFLVSHGLHARAHIVGMVIEIRNKHTFLFCVTLNISGHSHMSQHWPE